MSNIGHYFAMFVNNVAVKGCEFGTYRSQFRLQYSMLFCGYNKLCYTRSTCTRKMVENGFCYRCSQWYLKNVSRVPHIRTLLGHYHGILYIFLLDCIPRYERWFRVYLFTYLCITLLYTVTRFIILISLHAHSLKQRQFNAPPYASPSLDWLPVTYF